MRAGCRRRQPRRRATDERLGYRRTGIADVCEYDWTDESGRVHHEVEHDELLVKEV